MRPHAALVLATALALPGLALSAPAAPAKAKPAAATSAPAAKPAAAPAPAADLDLVALMPEPAKVETPAPQPAAAPAAPAPAKAPRRLGLRLSPRVGFGTVAENALGADASLFSAGLDVEYAFKAPMSVAVHFSDRFYRRLYATTQPDLSAAGLARTELDEQQLSADALFAYDLGPMLFKSGRVQLAPQAGPSFRLFHNEALRSQAGSVAAGARAGIALSDMLDVRAGGIYGYNFIFKNETLPSAVGGPQAWGSFDGSVGLLLAPGTRLGLGYEGEALVLRNSYRLTHSLAFRFDILL